MRVKHIGAGLLVLWTMVGVSAAAGDARLIGAVKTGNRVLVEELLRARAGVNVPEADGTTALHWAVRADDLQTVHLLLKAGADARVANRYGVTPLSLAATNGNAVMIETLLKAGADPNGAQAEGETPLMTAARTGKASAVKALLAHGAAVNATERWQGQTALMWAAAENHPDVVRLLVEHGADLNVRSSKLEFPKFIYNVNTMVRTPLPKGGMTALHLAARENAREGARALIEAGADLNLTDPDGTSALVMAIINRHNDVAALLIEKGADPNVADAAGMTALYAAVDMRALGPLTNRPTPKPTSTLDNAVLVKMLLDRGANPNAPLRLPTLPRFHNAGDALLGEGATPLIRAARTADLAVMRLLLDKGADPNLATRNYTTSLMISAGLRGRGRGGRGTGQTEVIDAMTLLVAQGADINAFNDTGLTPLHMIAERGDEEVVRFLVEKGADLDIRDKQGRTPLDVALRAPAAKSKPALLRQLTDNAAKEVPAATAQPGKASAQGNDGQTTQIWSGVYTAAQVERGKVLFTRVCRRCHAEDLSGRTAPALRGAGFIENWEAQDLKRLFEKIRDTMPPDNPESLADDEYLDLIAHLLQANGYPAGASPLDAQTAEDILIVRDPKEGPRELRNFSVVRVVGCLTKGPQDVWMLTRASEPALTRNRPSTAEELKGAVALPLGTHTFRLRSAAAFRPDSHQGYKVEAKGLLYKAPNRDRLSLGSLQMIDSACTNETH